LRMTRSEHAEALALARTLIPPAHIATYINGERLPNREALASETRKLETEVAGVEGGFRYVQRGSQITMYEVLDGETAHLYEMGIPIDEIACPWHIDVAQKVPLSLDRSSVRYGFRDCLQRAAAEIMSARLTPTQSRESWVAGALDFMDDDEAVRTIIKKRFGKAVVYDPSAPESNKLATDAGYKLIYGSELSKQAWHTVRRVGCVKPAGQVFDTGRVKLTPDGIPDVPRSEWTQDMTDLADYAGEFAEHVLGHGMEVIMYNDASLSFMGYCGSGTIAINVGVPDMKSAIENRYAADSELVVDNLLIHECAHDKVSDHLTHEFHRECCRIGAKARTLFRRWSD
jgi:hypothetical protein